MSSGTLTNRILGERLQRGRLEPGETITVSVDQALVEDATGTMCAMQYELLTSEPARVPLAVMYIDHNVLQIDDKNMQDHRYLQSFSEKFGLHYSPAGHGISHYIHLERFGAPGQLLVGADSHTSTAGALGMFAVGAGGLEVAAALAGYGFEFPCPRVIGVELTGVLPPAVEAKDIALELLRLLGVRGGLGAVFEFIGDGVVGLSVTERATIANMAIETGATTAVFPSDNRTHEWLREQGREEDFLPLRADETARYDEVLTIRLPDLVPLVARPHSPGNVVPVSQLPRTPIGQVCVGSSVNSSFEDLAVVAAAVRGRRVAAGIQVTATPGSKQILGTLVSSGVYADLMNAGVRMLEPVCGPCVGIGHAPLANVASLRTFNRNFPGRSGTTSDQVYLCSPATAAASAMTGVITDPRGALAHRPEGYGRAPAPAVDVHEILIVPPAPAQQARDVELIRGQNLVPPELPGPLPQTLDGEILITVGDDVSTGDMAPDGVIAMSVWSNIEACAEFMFRRLDPGFPTRARAASGGFIVGGENYGQGSSREHAALSPLHLGIRAIIARSFARIHRRNLIACGILPLVMAQPETPSRGTRLEIPGVRDALASGATTVSGRIGGKNLPLLLDLSAEERAVLLSGGLIAHIRAGKRPLVDTT